MTGLLLQIAVSNLCISLALAVVALAVEARAKHPHLASYQAEIDEVLDKSGNHEGRMAVLGTLLQAKMLEMQNELNKLVNLANKT